MEFLLFLSLKTIKKIPVGNCDNYTHKKNYVANERTPNDLFVVLWKYTWSGNIPVFTISHVKLTQSTTIEQKHFDL